MPDPSTYSEKELLQCIARGDERAFVLLFKQWHPFLTTHIFRITESRNLAEEIVQDVFLKIWMTRESLVEVNNFKAFLITVSRNHAINELKRLLREQSKRRQLDQTLQYGNESHAAKSVTDLQYALLDEAIDQLPARQKEVYLLNRHERLSYHDIAQKLGIGRESVKRNLQLASQSITKYIRNRLVLLILLMEYYK